MPRRRASAGLALEAPDFAFVQHLEFVSLEHQLPRCPSMKWIVHLDRVSIDLSVLVADLPYLGELSVGFPQESRVIRPILVKPNDVLFVVGGSLSNPIPD